MKKIKVCFIGFGSIAKRHIVNLTQICQEQKIEVTIDVCRSGVNRGLDPEFREMIQSVYYGIENIPDDYDIAFVTNPTKYHFDTLVKMKKKARNFFIEKPVFDRDDLEFGQIGLSCNGIYYVACPLRYKNVIQYLKKNIDFSKIYSIRSISSSYLPDWRPGTDYRATYSAHKELGGGVAIDLVHEWDYLTYLIGMPDKVYHLMGKLSNLEINSEDLAVYIAEYKDKYVELHLDYFGRETIRKVELYGQDDTVVCDLIANEINYLKEGKKISFTEERNDYQKRELWTFLAMIDGREANSNDVKNACQILKLAKGKI